MCTVLTLLVKLTITDFVECRVLVGCQTDYSWKFIGQSHSISNIPYCKFELLFPEKYSGKI